MNSSYGKGVWFIKNHTIPSQNPISPRFKSHSTLNRNYGTSITNRNLLFLGISVNSRLQEVTWHRQSHQCLEIRQSIPVSDICTHHKSRGFVSIIHGTRNLIGYAEGSRDDGPQ